MILKGFCLMDTKVQAFMPPFFLAHVGHAIRAVTELAADLNTTVGRHPGDFVLYEVCFFDDQTGDVQRLDLLINHGPVLAFIRAPGVGATVLPIRGPDVGVVSQVSDPETLARLNGRADHHS